MRLSKVLIASLLAIAIGCAPAVDPLAVATHAWPGYDLLRLADAAGELDHARARLVPTSGATESLAALADGRADAAMLTLDDVLRSNLAGVPLKVVLVIDISRGADALVARPSVDSLAALRGRRIGVETSAVGELMLRSVLAEARLQREDVVVVPFSGKHLDTWRTQALDAMITYEPALARLEGEGNRTLFDSRRIPHSIIDVLAVRPEALETRPRRARELVAAWLRGHRMLRANSVEAHYAMARMNGVSAEVTERAFQRLLVPGLEQNRQLLGGAATELQATCLQLSAVLGDDVAASDRAGCAGLFSADFLPGSAP